MKDLYTAMVALLLALKDATGKPIVYKCGIFNAQFDNEKQETPFKFPAVFIEFTDVNYGDMTYNAQAITDMTVRLHIGYKMLDIDDLAIFDIKQAIYQALQGWTGTPYFGRLTRVAEQPDYAHDKVLVWTQDYKTTGKDYSAAFNTKQIDTTTIPLLDLTITTAH